MGLMVNNTQAQGTVFSYQGVLSDGNKPANGSYDLRFSLYDALTNGALCADSISDVGTGITNGAFTVLLDFGDGAFNGASRWLEVAARTNGNSGQYTILTPRQAITAVPQAIIAGAAVDLLGALPAAQITGKIPVSQVDGTVPLAQLPSVVLTNNQQSAVLKGVFSGNGAGLTNVSYGVVNVRNFGAYGDGSHDDTSAIQSAIDSIKDIGGTLYFPGGRYKVTATLNLPLNGNMTPGGGSLPRYQITLRGDGQGNSHIVMTGAADLFNASFAWTDKVEFYAMADHYSFVDLDLIGPGASSKGAGLHFGLTTEPAGTFTYHEGIQWLKVEDCHITGFASGIAVTNCVEMFITRVFFESNYNASASLKKVDSISISDCFIGFDWAYGDGAGKTTPCEGIVLQFSLNCRVANGTFQSCKRVFNMSYVAVASIEGANWEDVFDGTEVILSKISTVNVNNARIGGGPKNPYFAFMRTDEGSWARLDEIGWEGDDVSSLIIHTGVNQPMYFVSPTHTERRMGYSISGGPTNWLSANFGASKAVLAPMSWNLLQQSNYIGMTFYNAPSDWNVADAGYYLVRTKLGATNAVVEDMIPSNLLLKDMGVNGKVTATNGLASLCSNRVAAVSCPTSGWTNTWNVAATVYIQGTSFTVNKNGVDLFSKVSGGVAVKLQPKEALTLSGTTTAVHAEPF